MQNASRVHQILKYNNQGTSLQIVNCIVQDKFIVPHGAVNLWVPLCQERAMAENINSSRFVLNVLVGAKAYCIIKEKKYVLGFSLVLQKLPLGAGQ